MGFNSVFKGLTAEVVSVRNERKLTNGVIMARDLSWPILGLIHESSGWWWKNGEQLLVLTVPNTRFEKTSC